MMSPVFSVFTASLAHNKIRIVLSVIAIGLGVALGYAVELINDTAVNELALSVQAISGEADIAIRGPRDGFDESLYPVIARMPEVATASPVVEIDAKLSSQTRPLEILGIDAFRAALIEPGLVATNLPRLELLRPDNLLLCAPAARELHLKPGDAVVLQAGLREVRLNVAGILTTGGQRRFAVMDIAGAQDHFDRLGKITRIDLRLKRGINIAVFQRQLQRSLPAGVYSAIPQATLQASSRLSRSYRVNLNVLALVALFTGGLLVFSTQALAVVRKRRQFALIRVLGLTRNDLLAFVLTEGAIVGACGALLGLGSGYALARLAIHTLGVDLGSGYFSGSAVTLAWNPYALGAYFFLGVLAALGGSFVPALTAVRLPIQRSLKSGDPVPGPSGRPKIWPGLAAVLLGAAATSLPPVSGLPLFGYAAIALLLLGTLILLPWFAPKLLAVLPSTPWVPFQLAVARLRSAPGGTALSLAAIVASAGLVVAMAIMVASFRSSLDAWLEHVLPAEVYVRANTGDNTAYLTLQDQQSIAHLPSVRHVEFTREQQLLLDPSRPRVVLLARPINAADPVQQLVIVRGPLQVAGDRPPPVWVSEATADLYGFGLGSVIQLPFGGRLLSFTVAGIWRDYIRQQGAIVIERARYIALTGDSLATSAALWLTTRSDLPTFRRELETRVGGSKNLELSTPPEIRAISLRVFDRTFAITYALELAALILGLSGLSASFASLVLERRAELGMLRHLGMTRWQIAAALAAEGLLVSATGLLVGLGLGGAMSLILISVINRQSFHWGMDLAIPWWPLAIFSATMLALSTLTAIISGRQAMGVDVIGAVKEDW